MIKEDNSFFKDFYRLNPDMSYEELVRNIRQTLQEDPKIIEYMKRNNMDPNVILPEEFKIQKEEDKTFEVERRIKTHKDICDYLHNLYITKNSDYGGSVTDTYRKFGLNSFLVRMTDKLNRVTALTNGKEQKVLDEKIEDTLLDLANYAILAVIELKEDKYKEGQ